jgi:O-antigen ligase/tetratricopeptide (TPR) repeat protein
MNNKEGLFLGYVEKIVVGLCYLILCVPLVAHHYFYLPFEVPRVLFFRFFVELLLVLYVPLAFAKAELRPKWRHPITLALLLFSFVLFLSAYFGVSWQRSFWGTLYRGGGLFTWLHVLAFFLVLTGIIQHSFQRLVIIRTCAIVGFLVILYAVAQMLGLSVYESGANRLTGTLGNAAMLAGCLFFILFSFGYLYICDTKLWRIFSCIGIVGTTIVMILTLTRGSVIGLVAGYILFFLHVIVFSKDKKTKKVICIGLCVVVFLLVSLFVFKNSELVQDSRILGRVTAIDIESGTVQERFHAWRGGLFALSTYPFFGWGLENFTVAYDGFFEVSYYALTKSESWFDRAHNVLVEYLVTTGILGFFSYCSIFGIFFYTVYKRKNDTILDVHTQALFSGVCFGYFIHNLFVFDSLSSFVLLVTFFSVLISLDKKGDKINNGFKNILVNKLQFFGIASLLTISVIFLLYTIHVPLARASLLTREVFSGLEQDDQDISLVIHNMRRSVSYSLYWDWELLTDYTEKVMRLVRENRDKHTTDIVLLLEDIDRSIIEIEKGGRGHNAKTSQRFARLYTLLFEVQPQNTYAKERALYFAQKSLSLSPNRLSTMYVLAHIYTLDSEYENAVAILDKAINLDKEMPDAYWSMALVYSKQGDMERMKEYTTKAVEHNFVFKYKDDVVAILPIFQETENIQALRFLYERLTKLEPENPQWYANLAAAHKELGEKEKAKKAVKQILKIDQNYREQVQDFINEL